MILAKDNHTHRQATLGASLVRRTAIHLIAARVRSPLAPMSLSHLDTALRDVNQCFSGPFALRNARFFDCSVDGFSVIGCKSDRNTRHKRLIFRDFWTPGFTHKIIVVLLK